MSGILKGAQLAQLLITGRHDLDGDALKLALMNEDFEPTMTGENTWAEIVGDECSGTGYTTGGKALTTLALSYDASGNCKLTADDVTWTALDVGEISYAVLLNSSEAVYQPIAYWPLDVTVEGSDFSVVWNDDGVLTFTIGAGVYKSFISYHLNDDLDLSADDLKMMLVKGYNPDVINDTQYSDVSGDEVSGSGYVAGGIVVTIPAMYSEHRYVEPSQAFHAMKAEDVEWAALDCDTPSHAILYDDTHVDKPLLFHFPCATAPDGGPYRLEWPEDVPDPIYPDVLYDNIVVIVEQE